MAREATLLHKGNGIGHAENVQGTHFEYRRFVRHAIAVRINVVAYHFNGLQTEMKLHRVESKIAHRKLLALSAKGSDHQDLLGRSPGVVFEANSLNMQFDLSVHLRSE
ncbi:MAG: hypothetical protein OXI92_18870, partial [Acidobacteriota bacterium]|nr:hypothetical protein [Acidobacteriota bacterium]